MFDRERNLSMNGRYSRCAILPDEVCRLHVLAWFVARPECEVVREAAVDQHLGRSLWASDADSTVYCELSLVAWVHLVFHVAAVVAKFSVRNEGNSHTSNAHS